MFHHPGLFSYELRFSRYRRAKSPPNFENFAKFRYILGWPAQCRLVRNRLHTYFHPRPIIQCLACCCFCSLRQIKTLGRSLTTKTQSRLWYTRWLLVVLTTATACCTRSTSMPRKLCNQFYTRPLVSKCRNESLIASQRHSQMIFTGCQCLRGLSTNSESSSTGDCIRLLQNTFKSCVCAPVTTTASHHHLCSAGRGDLQVLTTSSSSSSSGGGGGGSGSSSSSSSSSSTVSTGEGRASVPTS